VVLLQRRGERFVEGRTILAAGFVWIIAAAAFSVEIIAPRDSSRSSWLERGSGARAPDRA
jgi:hypothetical protein